MDNRVVSVLTANEPVTLAEVKLYLRINHDKDDTIIESMITQGRQMAEAYLSKDILSKSRETYIPYVTQEFTLPYSPINTSVDITIEVEGEETTDFTTFGHSNPSVRLGFKPAKDVKISYTTSGLGTEIKQGVLAAVAYCYKASGRANLEEQKNIFTDYKSLLAPYVTLYI